MPEYTYPVNITHVEYATTTEYRELLRTIFNMNPENFPEESKDEEIDDESRDEFAYDEAAAAIAMDYVFQSTQDNPLFQKLYQLAANKMLSEDPSIGLSILFCYDYLDVFHKCLVDYFQSPSEFTDATPSYQNVLQRLT